MCFDFQECSINGNDADNTEKKIMLVKRMNKKARRNQGEKRLISDFYRVNLCCLLLLKP